MTLLKNNKSSSKSPNEVLQKVLQYIEDNNLPLNFNRVVKVIEQRYPKFFSKFEDKIIPPKEKSREFFIQRKIFFQGLPKCDHCSSTEGESFYRNVERLYLPWPKYCSNSCSKSTEEVKAKRKESFQAKYGVDNPFQAEKVKTKIKETMVSRYGVEKPLQSKDIVEKMKTTVQERYGAEGQKEISERRAKTNLDKYSVAHPMQNDEVKGKAEYNKFERYGVQNPSLCVDLAGRLTSGNVFNKEGITDGVKHSKLTSQEVKGIEYLHERGYTVITTHAETFNYVDNQNRVRVYYPDVKVEKSGKAYYVELKSTYVAGLHTNLSDSDRRFNELLLKAKAVVDSGKTFMLLLMSSKGDVLLKSFGVPNRTKLIKKLGKLSINL